MQGRILFDDNGTIIHHRLRLRQYLLDGMLQQVAIDRYLTIDKNAKFLENGNITRERFAYLDRTANYTFVFEPGFNDHEVFPGKLSVQAHNIIIIQCNISVLLPQLCHIDGVPLDGTPAVVIHTHQIGLAIVFYILTTIGIAFAIGCLLFNFIYRERK